MIKIQLTLNVSGLSIKTFPTEPKHMQMQPRAPHLDKRSHQKPRFEFDILTFMRVHYNSLHQLMWLKLTGYSAVALSAFTFSNQHSVLMLQWCNVQKCSRFHSSVYSWLVKNTQRRGEEADWVVVRAMKRVQAAGRVQLQTRGDQCNMESCDWPHSISGCG